MRATPASKEARSKPLAGAITATQSPGCTAGEGRKRATNDGSSRSSRRYNEWAGPSRRGAKGSSMIAFLLWLLLLFVCWPLALLALVLYPIVWLVMLPFRLVGLTVEGLFALLRALIFLPARLLGGRP